VCVYSLVVAVKECQREARKNGTSLREYLTEGSDPMNAGKRDLIP